MAKIYVVATPIGNLEDITLRALSVLASVDFVLCEDTRTTRVLLDRHSISAKTISYHAQSGDGKVDHILELLREGKTLALVSDAGTPGISDPGTPLIARVRKEFEGEVEVVAVPGASAVVSALSISGLSSSEFLFLGFLPHKKGRQTLFREIADAKRTTVFYESPHRIEKTLVSLAESIPERRVVIAREITKMFEQVVGGTAVEVKDYFLKNTDKVRGEFVVMVEGK